MNPPEVKRMDKLAKRLRDDADRIEVEVSDELDRRIEASLHGVSPAREPQQAPAARPPWFWVASTVTGVAAALAVIAIVNLQVPDPVEVPPATMVAEELPPVIDLNAEAAMLTRPLEQELENLQSDLRKAEEKVKRDIGL